ncbi:hypothetical protein B0T16DRAFT_420035 [Cercophora newfieldiana]|uniref:Uncharacterized protein n=1 Tax=Cercophora newfieldiana TaxID=92897 RepID=A0AA39XY82_9PEZI|nr:hypothetical protein B0T16DRAFT_420035 [Cercophora newfieldiana]
MCTSTCPPRTNGSSPMRGRWARIPWPAEPELDRAMARGAARAAFADKTPATAGRVRAKGPRRFTDRRSLPLETLEETDETEEDLAGGSEDTASLSGGTRRQSTHEVEKLRNIALVLVRKTSVVSERVTVAYWRIVRPAFDAESELRRRLERGQSTWRDGLVFALAIMSVFLIMVAGVWAGRCLLWMIWGVRFLGRACAFLLGL